MEASLSSQSKQTVQSNHFFSRFGRRLKRLLAGSSEPAVHPPKASPEGGESSLGIPSPAADAPLLNSDEIFHLFRKSVTALGEIGAVGESNFLTLDGELQTIYAEAKRFAETVKNALFSDENLSLQQAVEALKRQAECLLDELTAGRATLTQNLNGLAEIETKLNTLSQQNGHLKRVAKNLKMVGMNISIENVQSHKTKAAYQVLADVTNQLAQKMAAAAEYISEDTRCILRRIELIQNDLDAGMQRLDKLTASARKTVEEALNEVEPLMRISLDMMDHIRRKSEAVKDHAGQLAEDLQIHEETSWRIAYIAASINEATEYMENAVSTASQQEEGFSNLGRAENINRLQMAQLKNLAEDMTKTGKRTKTALENLFISTGAVTHTEVAHMTAEEFIRRFDTQQHRPFEDALNAVFEHLIDLSNQGASDIDRIREVNRQVESAVHTMVRHLNHVRDINFDVHLKALNTIIKSTRSNKTGKAIEAIVLEMKSLAETSDTTIQRGIGLMKDVTTASQQLDQSALQKSPTHSNSEELLFHRGIEHFSMACDSIKNHLQSALNLSARLQAEISSASRGVAFFDQMAAAFNDCRIDLERVDTLFRPYMDSVDRNPSVSEQQAKEGFTMEGTRETRYRFDLTEGSADPSVEPDLDRENVTIDFF